jgi:hypothetical protein
MYMQMTKDTPLYPPSNKQYHLYSLYATFFTIKRKPPARRPRAFPERRRATMNNHSCKSVNGRNTVYIEMIAQEMMSKQTNLEVFS